MGGTDAEFGFVMFYVAFFTIIALMGSLGANTLGASGTLTAPVLPESVNPLLIIDFAVDLLVFFFGLGGLSVIGLPVLYSASLALILDVGLVYVLLRIARGG